MRVQKGTRNGNTLAFPARKLARVRLFAPCKPDFGEHLRYFRPHIFGQNEAKIFLRGEIGQELRRLEKIGKRPPALHAAFVRRESRKHVEKGRFSCSALAEHCRDLPFAQFERHIGERSLPAVFFCDVFEFHLLHLTIRT